MNIENENRKISLIEKDGLAVEVIGCPDEHGFVFAGPLAPETILSVSELLTAIDSIRSRIRQMSYTMRNAIGKFPFSVVVHSADTALDFDIIISPWRPAKNALLRAIREYFSDNTIRSSETFALLDMLEKAIGKPVKVDVDTTIRIVDAPFSFDDESREYSPDEFVALLNRVKGYISEDFASSFTLSAELKCDAFGFHTFSRYIDITVDDGPLPSVIDIALNDVEREIKANIDMPDEGVEFALFDLRLQKAILGWLNEVDDGTGDPAVDRMCEETRKGLEMAATRR